MIRILDITWKDLLQLVRDGKIVMFLLIMPVLFTVLFGYAFGGFGGGDDPRLPVGFLDLDRSDLSRQLGELLADSTVIYLQADDWLTPAALEAQVAEEDLAAAIIVPQGYAHAMLFGKPKKLVLIGDTASTAGMTVESEVLSRLVRLEGAVRTAIILEEIMPERVGFDYTLEQALSKWDEPPIRVRETTSAAISTQASGIESLVHVSPGMMLQFAIAGLLTSAQIMVEERKSRALQRMLTTATRRLHILFGHFLAILFLIVCQFTLLILFGQYILGVNYLAAPLAVALVALCSALCIAALGLLIGVLARTEEQAIIFSLVPMFVLAGLGGAWVPLEMTGKLFQTIGYVSPIAWAMDGFKNVTLRGLGIESVLLPAAALLGYAVIFFLLATWRFRRVSE